jgi:hypothetical protein
MKKNLRLFIIPALIVLFVLTACNLPFKIGQKVNDTDADTTASSSTKESSPRGGLFNGAQTAAPTAIPTIDAKPVGVQEGLGSFDSYRMRMQANSSDSDGKIDNYAEYIERSVKDGATHSHMESTTFDPANNSEQNTSSSDIYEVGLVTCQKSDSDDSWSYSEMTDDDKELTDIFKGMVDFVPVIDNPTFAGADTVHGIPSNHFTFQIEGIGAKSGAVATTNSGEYWVALDGQYLVKYSLELEVHSADNKTWNKLEVLMDLTDVNSDAIDIEQPTDCVKSE